MRNGLKLILLVVVAVVVTQLLVRTRSGGGSPKADHPAPALALTDLGGRPVDLSRLRGKVVAVNFWASWCGPCREELPELAEFWRAYSGQCFELLGVAEQSGHADVLAASRGIPYPVLLDARADYLEPWGVNGFPVTFVIDPEGKVRKVFRGGIAKEDLAAVVDPLLPATCPRS
jgi:cytochrome c biogenesis protein CcmG, thiol:disulfide interchange protein DsbE